MSNDEMSSLAGSDKKRTRTSPRTKALDEVLKMMSENLSDFEEERAETDESDLDATTALDAKIALLTDLSGKVKSLADDGVPKPVYAGRHYISVAADGTRAAFDSNTVPTVRSHGPDSKFAFKSVLGPFRTTEGVDYRLARPETDCPVVF